MSGGAFDYWQYHISHIAECVESYIANNNDETPNDWGYPRGRGYSPSTIARFKEAVFVLNLAYTYAQRIDWLVSDDDGEQSFHERLNQELDEIFNQFVEQRKILGTQE